MESQSATFALALQALWSLGSADLAAVLLGLAQLLPAEELAPWLRRGAHRLQLLLAEDWDWDAVACVLQLLSDHEVEDADCLAAVRPRSWACSRIATRTRELGNSLP